MRVRLHPILEADWPALAWIARCEVSSPVITVRHGPQVETMEDWLCEAVWDGEFEAGDFDRTDLEEAGVPRETFGMHKKAATNPRVEDARAASKTARAAVSPATWRLPPAPRPPSTGIRDPGR
jgi:hypothetical protein